MTKEAALDVFGEWAAHCGTLFHGRFQYGHGSLTSGREVATEALGHVGIGTGVGDDDGVEAVDEGGDRIHHGRSHGGMHGLSTDHRVDIVRGAIDDALDLTTVEHVAQAHFEGHTLGTLGARTLRQIAGDDKGLLFGVLGHARDENGHGRCAAMGIHRRFHMQCGDGPESGQLGGSITASKVNHG